MYVSVFHRKLDVLLQQDLQSQWPVVARPYIVVGSKALSIFISSSSSRVLSKTAKLLMMCSFLEDLGITACNTNDSGTLLSYVHIFKEDLQRIICMLVIMSNQN